MTNDPAISIALATYNGAPYLRAQLDSLAAQERLPFELVVCDDGSVDDTLRILDEFAAQAPFPVRVHRNVANLGYGDNFLKAARLCNGDWIAFCDQDDLWLPHKISKCADAITRSSGLTIVLQNAHLCDANLEPIGGLFPNRIAPGIYGPNRQHAFWVWQGFLVTFRSTIMRLDSVHRPLHWARPSQNQPHDTWVCMLGNVLGGVAVLDGPAALYRRHDRALTGENRRPSLARVISSSMGARWLDYAHFAGAACSSSRYLKRMAAETEECEWHERLSRSSVMLNKFSQILRERARLYRASSFKAGLGSLVKIARMGGYLGEPLIALGWKSGFKDALVALGALRCLKNIPRLTPKLTRKKS